MPYMLSNGVWLILRMPIEQGGEHFNFSKLSNEYIALLSDTAKHEAFLSTIAKEFENFALFKNKYFRE